jgi:hypothetical protein
MVFSGAMEKVNPFGGAADNPIKHYTIKQLSDWFHRLVAETGMFDFFLVFAAISGNDRFVVQDFSRYGAAKEQLPDASE